MAPIDKFSGSTFTGVTTLSGNALVSISEVDDIIAPSLIPEFVKNLFLYTFDAEENGLGDQQNNPKWSPGPDMNGVSGTNCVDEAGVNLSDVIIWRNQGTPCSEFLQNGDSDEISDLVTIDFVPGTTSTPILSFASTVSSEFDANPFIPVGWNCVVDEGTTSDGTGPSGSAVYPYTDETNTALNPDSGSINIIPDTDETLGGFLYTETSGGSPVPQRVFITAFCVYGLTQLMDNPSSNKCLLKFLCHAQDPGTILDNDMGDLGIFSSTSDRFHIRETTQTVNIGGGQADLQKEIYPRINQRQVAELELYKELAFFSANSLRISTQGINQLTEYFEITIDLQELLDIELADGSKKYHWIYFVYGNANTFHGDCAIDNVRVEEHTP